MGEGGKEEGETRGGGGKRSGRGWEEEDPADQYVTPSPSGSPRIPPKERQGLRNNTSNSITVYHRDPDHCLCPAEYRPRRVGGKEREGGREGRRREVWEEGRRG